MTQSLDIIAVTIVNGKRNSTQTDCVDGGWTSLSGLSISIVTDYPELSRIVLTSQTATSQWTSATTSNASFKHLTAKLNEALHINKVVECGFENLPDNS